MHIGSSRRLSPTHIPRTILLVLGAALLATPLFSTAQGMQDAASHASHSAHPAAPISDMLTLSVDGRSLQLTPADLAALPQTTVKVHNSHTNADEQFTGVALSDLLARAGIALAPGTEHRFFHSYLRAQGTDNYFVLYSGTEIMSSLHTGNTLVALRANGKPLGADGHFRLVSTDDLRPARWVRNLTSLTFTTVN